MIGNTGKTSVVLVCHTPLEYQEIRRKLEIRRPLLEVKLLASISIRTSFSENFK